MNAASTIERTLAALDAARLGPDADAETEALAELEAAVRANLGMFRPEDQQRALEELIDRLSRGLKIEGQHERFLLRVALDRRDLLARAERAEAEVARLRAALVEVMEYEGGSESPLEDQYLVDRIRAALEPTR